MRKIYNFCFAALLICSGMHTSAQSTLLFSDVATGTNTNVPGWNTVHRTRQVNVNGPIDFTKPVVFNFFSDAVFECTLTKQDGFGYGDNEVWTGRVQDDRFDHLPHFRNVTLVYNRTTQHISANVETAQGYFEVLPAGQGNVHIIRQFTSSDMDCRTTPPVAQRSNGALSQLCGTACIEEKDSLGNYVLDVFVGYSDSAARQVPDINAHALLMLGSVNSGLANSLVDSVRMRLVGTGITGHNPGIITSVLSDCYDWFAHEIDSVAADFVVVFQTPTGAPNEAGGWGGVGGYSSVNSIYAPNAYRHEMGHNVGGGHCPGDGSIAPIAHGYNNGNWRTHLCGNDVNFYSTPLVNDNLGHPIGRADSADMAQEWRIRSAEMAQRRLHRVPYYHGDTCVALTCLPSHWGGQNDLIKRVQFNTIDNNQATPAWTCTSLTGYSSYLSQSTTVQRSHSYTLTVTPNFSWAESKLAVWIDWNQDGRFDSIERVAAFARLGPWTDTVTVPATVAGGWARMRVRLQYATDTNFVFDPCDGAAYSGGETEDYSVYIDAPAAGLAEDLHQYTFTINPNPATSFVHITANSSMQIQFYNSIGQLVKQAQIDKDTWLSVSDLAKGIYLVKPVDQSGGKKLILE